MINKIFGSAGAGSPKASINYLLDEKKHTIKPQVLKGNPKLSQKIAENLDFKTKYTVGCLSFAEANLPLKTKTEIMDKFEQTFFAGLDKEQYNICWIEHTDKGRLELNYFIPNVELTSGKRLQPYYDKADRHLSNSFQNVINSEYNLKDPNSLENKRAIKEPNLNTPADKKTLINTINEAVTYGVKNGTLNNQKEIAKFLEINNLEIDKLGKNYISIKDPNGQKNIRLKGAFYEQDFRNNAEFGKQLQETIRRDKSNSRTTLQQHNLQLQNAVTKRCERNRKQYPNNAEKYTRAVETSRTSDSKENNDIQQVDIYRRDISRSSSNGNIDIGRDRDILRAGKTGIESRNNPTRTELTRDKREPQITVSKNIQREQLNIPRITQKQRVNTRVQKEFSNENKLIESRKYADNFRTRTKQIFERIREFFRTNESRNIEAKEFQQQLEQREQQTKQREQQIKQREQQTANYDTSRERTKSGINRVSERIAETNQNIDSTERQITKSERKMKAKEKDFEMSL